MLDLNDFFYFMQVVDHGGFTAASRVLRIPKSTLSHRLQQLEAELGIRLLNRTSRHLAMTDAGAEFYRHAAALLREADLAESAMRQRLAEPTGTVRCAAAMATMQFTMGDLMAAFLMRYPKVAIVAQITGETVDIVDDNYDVAIGVHLAPLPASTLLQRTFAPAPCYLFAGATYLEAHEAPQTPLDLQNHPSLFLMRKGVAPVWRLRDANAVKNDVAIPLQPRLLSDDMMALKQAAIAGLGIVALPAYVCREEVRSRSLRRVLPLWRAGDSTITALLPYRRGLLPAVGAFVDHLAAELPKAVLI